MPRHSFRFFHRLSPVHERSARVACCLALMLAICAFPADGAAWQAELGFSPASGEAQVIAQGVVALPEGEAVWRTVRRRALVPDEAPFTAWPLGFVLASSGPLLLVDQATGVQTHLGTGEATLVRDGTVQQRSSLASQPVSYLAIELVPSDAAAPDEASTVLQPGQPFPAPTGLHDLDLVSDSLRGDETLTIPDSGATNAVLVTDGAASVRPLESDPVVLLAGEAASFSGALEVSVASGGTAGAVAGVSFVVAVIGAEVPPPLVPAAISTPQTGAATAVAETPEVSTGAGSIAVEIFTCPPGMSAETLAAATCTTAIGDFDVTLSGPLLDVPLTLGDATASGGAFTWNELPFGNYLVAEAVLPTGATTYVLASPDAVGGPETGYRITLEAEQPDMNLRIYNFAPD